MLPDNSCSNTNQRCDEKVNANPLCPLAHRRTVRRAMSNCQESQFRDRNFRDHWAAGAACVLRSPGCVAQMRHARHIAQSVLTETRFCGGRPIARLYGGNNSSLRLILQRRVLQNIHCLLPLLFDTNISFYRWVMASLPPGFAFPVNCRRTPTLP